MFEWHCEGVRAKSEKIPILGKRRGARARYFLPSTLCALPESGKTIREVDNVVEGNYDQQQKRGFSMRKDSS